MRSAAASADEDCVARLLALDPGLYAFSLGRDTGWRDPIVGLALPAVQIAAPPELDAGIEITDIAGQPAAWLGGRRRMLFVRATVPGSVLVTAYLARQPEIAAPALEIRRVDGSGDWSGPAEQEVPPFLTLRLEQAVPPPEPGQPASLDIVAHVRGRGDLRFSGDDWVGRLGSGMWIEAFAILPRHPAILAAIEYKGLTGSGAETPWLAAGALCGTRGRATPLIGFAVRQKAGAGELRLDCEYSGCFQSGATAGPARSGAPCLSPSDDDPLEGMQLRIVPRPAPARVGSSGS